MSMIVAYHLCASSHKFANSEPTLRRSIVTKRLAEWP